VGVVVIGRRVERRSTEVLVLRSEDEQTAPQAFDHHIDCAAVARFGLIDRSIREVTSRLEVLFIFVTLDS
jgi:hypothetical protein